jgi:hypothetical protein
MTWVTTAEVDRFLAHAEPFLLSDPVANNALVTEARFWSQLSDPAPGARFGWWAEDRGTQAAFVDLPDHATICSPLQDASIADLAEVLASSSSLGVEARDEAAVTEVWRAQGKAVSPTMRLTLLRLGSLRARALPEGRPRVADADDLPLLRSWFTLFQERQPDDPSHVEFVVDRPLEAGGITVWEVRGHPVAMASRTPTLAGMTRMGLAFQPTEGSTYSEAAFVSACVDAARAADAVLVLSAAPRSAAAYTALGFVPVLDRVVLEVRRDAQT